MLCHFCRTQNGSVATRFCLLSSTAMSSAIGCYVVFLERFVEMEEPATIVLFQNIILRRTVKSCIFLTCNHVFRVLFYSICMNLTTLSFYGISFDLVFCTIIFCVSAGISTLMYTFDGLDPYIFRSKMEKARYMREGMGERCFFPVKVCIFSFDDVMIKAPFTICTLTCRVNNYVSRQEKCRNRRNESTIVLRLLNFVALKNTLYFR